MESANMSQQKLGFFTKLPSEMQLDILSRLPVPAVRRCKCVCKSWLNLLETDEFKKFHFLKAVPGLAVNDPDSCAVYDFNDRLDLEAHELHYELVLFFNFIHYAVVQGSVNGVLLMCYQSMDPHDLDRLFVLNPVTFECISIRSCADFMFKEDRVVSYGFGESRESKLMKVVRVCHDCDRDYAEELLGVHHLGCRVYTLGTGSWRSVAHDRVVEYDPSSVGALLHGNIHWLVFDNVNTPLVSCFDLEDEVFTFFPCPEVPPQGELVLNIHAMEDCLVFSDNVSDEEFVVWIMRDYTKKTWKKEVVIKKVDIPNSVTPLHQIARAVKIFKDGDMLIVWGGMRFYCYSSKTKTARELNVFELNSGVTTILHTSTFFSLRNFPNETVYLIR